MDKNFKPKLNVSSLHPDRSFSKEKGLDFSQLGKVKDDTEEVLKFEDVTLIITTQDPSIMKDKKEIEIKISIGQTVSELRRQLDVNHKIPMQKSKLFLNGTEMMDPLSLNDFSYINQHKSAKIEVKLSLDSKLEPNKKQQTNSKPENKNNTNNLNNNNKIKKLNLPDTFFQDKNDSSTLIEISSKDYQKLLQEKDEEIKHLKQQLLDQKRKEEKLIEAHEKKIQEIQQQQKIIVRNQVDKRFEKLKHKLIERQKNL